MQLTVLRPVGDTELSELIPTYTPRRASPQRCSTVLADVTGTEKSNLDATIEGPTDVHVTLEEGSISTGSDSLNRRPSPTDLPKEHAKMHTVAKASASHSMRRGSHYNVDNLGEPLEDHYRLDSSGALTKQLTIGGREMPSVLPKPATRDATGTLVLGTQ